MGQSQSASSPAGHPSSPLTRAPAGLSGSSGPSSPASHARSPTTSTTSSGLPRRKSLELPDLAPLQLTPTTTPPHQRRLAGAGGGGARVPSPLVDSAVAQMQTVQGSYFPLVPPASAAAEDAGLPDFAGPQAGGRKEEGWEGKERKEEEGRTPETVLTWNGGGEEVYVTYGDEWKERIKMIKSNNDFTLSLPLPPGHHRVAFLVDQNWRVSDDLQTATDGDGHLVNYIEVPRPGAKPPLSERQAAEARRRGSGKKKRRTVDPTPPTAYTSDIPPLLQHYAALESSPPPPSTSPPPPPLPEPPMLPRQLERVVLNSQPAHTSTAPPGATLDDNSVLPVPNHVTLQHLTASAIRGGVLAVGTTTRYKRKFVSTIYYKPI